MNTFEKYESEVRSYCRHYPVVFTRAKGAVMTDESGKEYLDFFCGAGALNYGHNHPYIKNKVIEYLESDGIIHSLDMYTAAKRDFIETFETRVLQPRGLDYKLQFVSPSGTNAVEAALKLARKVKGRSGVFALMGGFHGMTLGSLALTTDAAARNAAGVSLDNVTHIPAPYMFPALDTIDYIETILTDDHSGIAKPAAFVLETVQADGGIYPLEVEWLKRLRALCTKYDILMVVDDIQAGSARTGWFFSFERAGIQPDIVTLSKSIGGCGMPFSLVMIRPELDKWAPGEHTGTFRGNQLAFVAGKAGLEVMLNEHIESEVRRKSVLIERFLTEKILPMDARIEVRGIGFMWGLDFGKIPGASAAMVSACFRNGLIAENAGRGNNVLKLFPPLIISDEDLLRGLEIVRKSLAEVLGK